ncbi:hypothetical protein EST38_g9024 [Candolleomyces aberdarensis]|uniref:Nephrocystin 3-like N-terminal domain-containing protein n=1 Tax=Candolleomyces aberdarensis TaxID=2316362 RepID=A0A4V1Q2Z8_9AGAR|nr:hypothetical protein EST38_g9024 [Candolleomyces aberdarensis]
MSSVSYFNNANNFVANNPTFTSTIYVSGTDALQFLCKHSATGAMHDSEERCPPPMCHKGTGEAIVVRIQDWYGCQARPGKPIMWVHAPAGYGKTAIAGTTSKMLEETVGSNFSPLGATFFFWRTSPERNNPARFIITIAYQLAMSIPELASHVENAVKRNPMILWKALEVQLVKLIVEPFKSLGEFEDIPNRLVIIDGLDECINSEQESRVEKKYAEDREKVHVRVLELIYALQSHRLPLSFLILSRPEAWIKQHIESIKFEDVVETMDLFEVGDRMGDVEKYLRAELARIAANIGDEEWPGEETAHKLVSRSNGHLLYASTVIRHIDDPYDDPRERLKNILNSYYDFPPDSAYSTPFASLSELYLQIMRSCPASSRSLMVEVLEDITVTRSLFLERFGLQPALPTLDSLSGRAPGSGIRAIRGLHAVLRPTNPNAADDRMLTPFIHPSFSDFLMDPELSFDFSVDEEQGTKRLFGRCLERMSTITTQDKVEEIVLQLALIAFQSLWDWSNEEDVQSCQVEYLKAFQELLKFNLAKCFIKLISPPASGFDFVFVAHTSLNFLDSFHSPGEHEALDHVYSSIERALIHLLYHPPQIGVLDLNWPLTFRLQNVDRLYWIYMTKPDEWKSDEFVRLLKGLRRDGHRPYEECFNFWMSQIKLLSRAHRIKPVLDYIYQDED